MAAAADVVALRRAVLVASLLDDVPVVASDAGAVLAVDPRLLPGQDVVVPWHRLVRALAGAPATSLAGRLRLRDWLRARQQVARLLEVARLLADAGEGPAGGVEAVLAQVVPLALPPGHALHPGAGWVCEQVRGGVLDLGLGLRLASVPDAAPDTPPGAAPDTAADAAADAGVAGRGAPVVPLAPGVLACAGLPAGTAEAWWPQLRERLDQLGGLAAARLQREGTTVVTALGGCDALTLLASPTLRRHLAAGDGIGMRSVGAPMRTRVWFDLRRIDPAFVVAAAAATDAEQRGVDRPLLVTVDELTDVEPRAGGSLHLVLDGPAGAGPGGRRRS